MEKSADIYDKPLKKTEEVKLHNEYVSQLLMII